MSVTITSQLTSLNSGKRETRSAYSRLPRPVKLVQSRENFLRGAIRYSFRYQIIGARRTVRRAALSAVCHLSKLTAALEMEIRIAREQNSEYRPRNVASQL